MYSGFIFLYYNIVLVLRIQIKNIWLYIIVSIPIYILDSIINYIIRFNTQIYEYSLFIMFLL